MKIKKYIITIAILFFGILSNLYSLDDFRGIELCNQIYNLLERKDLHPQKQDLLLKGDNEFPYNIIVNISSEEYTDQNIVFTFLQEDVLKNQKIISDFINYVKLQNYDFNTVFLFSYGEREIIKKQGNIYGIDSFLQNINSNDDYTAIIVDLASSEDSIQTSSNGITAPSWLIQNEYNAYIKYNIKGRIPYFYLSQLYTNNFFHNRLLSLFFDYNVPAVKLNFNEDNINNELVYSILKTSIESYSNEYERLWDQHFLMINLFGQFKKLTEVGTIKIIILIIFAWLVFILLLIFINIRMKKNAWGALKHIWYVAPLSFFIVYISFIIGKYLSIGLFQSSSNINNVFILIGTELILSIVFVSLYYVITLKFNYSFQEKSIDYLIVMSCFFNQSFFILIDVSLFPIFMTVCLLSILALSIKNNGVHIAIFFLMVIPYLPYVISLIRFSNFDLLYDFFISENYVPFIVALIVFPFYLIYFRVLTSVKRHSKHNIFVVAGSAVTALSMVIIILFIIISTYLKHNELTHEPIKIFKTYEKIIDCKYSDKVVFDDIIRTVKIDFKEQPEQCNVNVSSLSSSPILYTENDFEYITPTTSTFNLPSNPPKALTFTYGASKEPALITISAIFPTDKNNVYKSIEKVVTIGK